MSCRYTLMDLNSEELCSSKYAICSDTEAKDWKISDGYVANGYKRTLLVRF